MSSNFARCLLVVVLLLGTDVHANGMPSVPTWKKELGCHEVGSFHVSNPPPVTCSEPQSCSKGLTTMCQMKKKVAYLTICKKRDHRRKCIKWGKKEGFVNICDRWCKDPDVADGTGDPHLTTFDGIQFDFQGEPGSHYVVFSKSDGDKLVTRMRGSPFFSHGTKATYFNAFGLTTGTRNSRIQMEIVPREADIGKWSLKVHLNGEMVSEEGSISLSGGEGTMEVTKDSGGQIIKVVVTSMDAEYIITAQTLWKITAHLDISLTLKHTPSSQYMYGGLLGNSLNRLVGNLNVDSDDQLALVGTTRDGVSERQMELEMRSKFFVRSLFPPQDEDVNLKTASRITSNAMGMDLTGLTLTATVEQD